MAREIKARYVTIRSMSGSIRCAGGSAQSKTDLLSGGFATTASVKAGVGLAIHVTSPTLTLLESNAMVLLTIADAVLVFSDVASDPGADGPEIVDDDEITAGGGNLPA